MKIIFMVYVRQSLDIFCIVEYNFNGNQDEKSHWYSEERAFILKSIDPLLPYNALFLEVLGAEGHLSLHNQPKTK